MDQSGPDPGLPNATFEKPTVLHTGDQRAATCGNSKRDTYMGTYRAHRSRVAGDGCRRAQSVLQRADGFRRPTAPPGPKVLSAGTLVRGGYSGEGVDSLMTEDPRQTRRNGSDPLTAQSRSARSGWGSSRRCAWIYVALQPTSSVNGVTITVHDIA